MKYFILIVVMVAALGCFYSLALLTTAHAYDGHVAQITGSGGNPNAPISGSGGNPNAGRIPNPLGSNVNSITDLLKKILTNIVLPIGSVVIVFMVIWTGYKFVMAGGSPDKIQDAKHMLLYVLIGAAILLGSLVMVDAIQTTVCKIIAPSNCDSSPVIR